MHVASGILSGLSEVRGCQGITDRGTFGMLLSAIPWRRRSEANPQYAVGFVPLTFSFPNAVSGRFQDKRNGLLQFALAAKVRSVFSGKPNFRTGVGRQNEHSVPDGFAGHAVGMGSIYAYHIRAR